MSGSASCSTPASSCPGWPPELGGRNATPVEQMIYFEEMKKHELPRSYNPQGLGIIAPSILDYGTEEQKQRLLLPTLRAEIAWSLGMSEPGAGQRPREPQDARRARRRPLRRERAEGLDVGRAPRRLEHVLRAHRPRRAEAQGHQRAHHRHEDAGRRAASVPRAQRPRLHRLQRGVLHRRRGAAGEPARRAQRRLGAGRRVARARAGDAVDRLRVRQRARRAEPASRSATSRGPTAARCARTRSSEPTSRASTSTRRR